MKFDIKKESALIALMLLPLIILFYLWPDLPESMPVHFNIEGKADNYASKQYFAYIIALLSVLPYVLGLIIPFIDPKKRIESMGGKYYSIRFVLSLFLSALAVLVIYYGINQSMENSNYMIILIGLFFVFLGNYMKTVKPNYFLGIRTPWALENEFNWKKTHQLGAKLWFSGGLIIVVASLILKQELSKTVFTAVVIIIAAVPFAYSYLLYKRGNEKSININ